MRIAVCQTDMEWMNPERNLERLEPLLPEPGPTWCCCPRCSPRASCSGPRRRPNRTAVRSPRRCSAGHAVTDVPLPGSLAVSENGRFFNRMLFVYPSGECAATTNATSSPRAARPMNIRPATAGVVVTYRGVRFLLLVCYDLRFPVWSRSRDDYDAHLCCASWPASRRDVWRTLLRARAIENQCFVAGANRTGRDPVSLYSGDSVLLDCRGRALAEAGSDPATLVSSFDLGAQRLSARNSPPGAMPMTSACFSDCASLFFPAESRIFTR